MAKYCDECGKPLIHKEIGDEGLLPFCEPCGKTFFPQVTPCIIVGVINEFDEILLLKQDYVTTESWVLVAGYISLNEKASECMIREVSEETNQKVLDYKFITSYPYPKKNMLMFGYVAYVKKEELVPSKEVDQLKWFKLSEADKYIREGSIAHQLVEEIKTV